MYRMFYFIAFNKQKHKKQHPPFHSTLKLLLLAVKSGLPDGGKRAIPARAATFKNRIRCSWKYCSKQIKRLITI